MKGMKGKKIFGIGAAVLLVTLTFTSTATSETITEFIEKNKDDLATIGGYLQSIASDYNSGQPIPDLPKDMEMKINNIIMKMQQIVENFYNKSNLSIYGGKNTNWISIGIWQFFIEDGDLNFYYGHCWAFSNKLVGYICDLFLKEINFVILMAILFMVFVIIFGLLTATLLMIIVILNYEVIKEIFEKWKSHPNGLVLFYFDRVDKILRIYDKIEGHPQPGDPDWDPTHFFPNTEWKQVI
jgi:hypothetical protein